ncbi:hypothetical protein EW146_g7400 [Bondarzewia mesenterica]|uniref:Nucleolus and neural progenitor protein-like N-terminal domain-containing protein n=1 Tax=Bondarzewia mesenterica TaxID=1095465 RepID=A0A4S4LMR8_9AGAM|nr:hypothetical protein EW146_g7400 [Bondarzewia mesenterica]
MTRNFHSRSPPKFDFLPRTALNPTSCDAVNIFLKLVKTKLKRAQLVHALHADEMAVLERLFYKGKNQHRSSLFWQRVSEMRRYGHRLQGITMCATIEALRASFYGEESVVIAKRLKGAWTHYPSSTCMAYVLNQLHVCHLLVEKSRDRLQDIYRFFTLIMQDGAFIQLTLTMIAIASRLHQLVTDAREFVISMHNDCYRVFQALHPNQIHKIKPLTVSGVPLPSPEIALPAIATAVQPFDTPDDEDIGQCAGLSRGSPLQLNVSEEIEAMAVIIQDPLFTIFAESKTVHETVTSLDASHGSLKIDQVTDFTTSSVSSGITVKKRKVPGDDEKLKAIPNQSDKVKKAKKKKKDEIDDIFG